MTEKRVTFNVMIGRRTELTAVGCCAAGLTEVEEVRDRCLDIQKAERCSNRNLESLFNISNAAAPLYAADVQYLWHPS
eukprot:6176778-Pleurochrysis_carterae.AAC.3